MNLKKPYLGISSVKQAKGTLFADRLWFKVTSPTIPTLDLGDHLRNERVEVTQIWKGSGKGFEVSGWIRALDRRSQLSALNSLLLFISLSGVKGVVEFLNFTYAVHAVTLPQRAPHE